MRIIQIEKFSHVTAHAVSAFSLTGRVIRISTPEADFDVAYEENVPVEFVQEQYGNFLRWLNDTSVKASYFFAFDEFPDSGVEVIGG
jgi:hypothetical protein